MPAGTLLLLALQAPAIPLDSYADSATAELVALARAARHRNERLVTAYSATVSQRIGVGIRALSRDRMLYRQELAAQIRWFRDSISTIEALGARQGVPAALRGDAVPEDLASDLRWLVVNPAEDYLDIIGSGTDGFVYPLKYGAEADYRFARGDTTRITLPTGQVVRLVELRVTPRRGDWQLMAGSLWFDGDTHGLVRAVFRPARPYEWQRDGDPDDRRGLLRLLNFSGQIHHVSMEYGLYEGRWWMLRYVAVEGTGSMGNWLDVPVRFERTYREYQVRGGTPPPVGSTFRPAGTRDRLEPLPGESAEQTTARRQARADSLLALRSACIEARGGAPAGPSGRAVRRDCWREVYGDTALAIVIPDDTLALLASATLGPPILGLDDLITEAELRGLAEAIAKLPSGPLGRRLELPRGLESALKHARYNRVEALSLGLRVHGTAGRFSADALGRIGLGDLRPGLEFGLTSTGRSATWRLGGYHGLRAANPDSRPFGALNSVWAAFFQRDDGEYFRATGVSLTSSMGEGGWLTWRAYAEQQRPAALETQFSLPHLFDRDQRFRPNIVADRADQIGTELGLRAGQRLAHSLWLGGELGLDAAGGDFHFGRARGTVRAIVTPDGPWALALEGAAGTSTGEVPVQSRFYLGGPATLRGYPGGILAGDAFWRVRAEIGNAFPAARLTLFSDVGWAGPRAAFGTGAPLHGAGIGAGFLDGLIRLDLARAWRSPTGWRFDLYFDGRL